MTLRDEVLSLSPRANPMPPAARAALERSLREGFGGEGVRVYRSLSGSASLRDVRETVGLTDSELIAILRFLVKNGALDMHELAFGSPLAAEDAPEPLSGDERLVGERFGGEGVAGFRLLAQGVPPAEVSARSGMREDDVVELIDFLHAKGILGPEGGPEGGEADEAAVPDEAEAAHSSAEPEARRVPRAPPADLPPIYVPTRKRLGLFAKLKVEAELLRRFGPKGLDAYNLVDGRRLSVRIAKDVKAGFGFLGPVFEFLYSEGAIDLRMASGDDIHERYGDEGVAVSEVYGRDGLLIYDLINKKLTVAQIIEASGVPPERGVEMLAFIHRLLGVEIPFDADGVLKRLSKK